MPKLYEHEDDCARRGHSAAECTCAFAEVIEDVVAREGGNWVVSNRRHKYWNNTDGWVSHIEDADRYTSEEMRTCTLPIDGQWEKIAVTETHRTINKLFSQIADDEDWDDETAVGILTEFIADLEHNADIPTDFNVMTAFEEHLRIQRKKT